MIIDCPKCDKKFELDQNLIPIDGRLLQCGNCSNKWFFKLKNLNEIKKDDILITCTKWKKYKKRNKIWRKKRNYKTKK